MLQRDRGARFVAGLGEEDSRANVRATIKRMRRKFEAMDARFAALGNHPARATNGGAMGSILLYPWRSLRVLGVVLLAVLVLLPVLCIASR